MNGYELSRIWFNWCFENPEKIKPNHTALYFFCVEHCNRLGWKSKFGLPTTMAKEAIGIRSYNAYSQTLQDLVDWGFITMVERSKNQHSSNIVALSNFDKALDNALDKATIKHATKQSESTGESIGSIDKPLTIEPLTINQENSFDIFWKEYNWNVGKRQTENEWSIITKEMPSEIPKILINVPKYVVSKPDLKYRKKPENYLKERVWQDEIVMPNATVKPQETPEEWGRRQTAKIRNS